MLKRGFFHAMRIHRLKRNVFADQIDLEFTINSGGRRVDDRNTLVCGQGKKHFGMGIELARLVGASITRHFEDRRPREVNATIHAPHRRRQFLLAGSRPANEIDAGRLGGRGAVVQIIEDADFVPGRYQLVHHRPADKTTPTGHENFSQLINSC